jgi:predicted AAA+ superfamily ATPase
VGEYPDEDGHYITVWAPRQCGKTWVMQEVKEAIKKTDQYEIGIISMQRVKKEQNEKKVLSIFIKKLNQAFEKSLPDIQEISDIPDLFTKQYFQKPVILILDEFDSLIEEFINDFASIFRDIFISRTNEKNKKSREKTYLLHGLALVGVRSVLGIESVTGSPFNVQRSLHIPNLTDKEAAGMFKWYEKESGQRIQPQVIDKLYEETRGQPGLTGWFGELLTETYNEKKDRPITMDNFEEVYATALSVLPNANILNIISKAKKEEYKQLVLEIFQSDEPIEFKFADRQINFLYMNGVIEPEKVSPTEFHVRFANPFVQKQLFNYFSNEIFHYMGRLVEPFDTLEDTITEQHLNTINLIKRYQTYLAKNKDWLLEDAPRRKDMKIFEAVYHFNLYMYLYRLLKSKGCKIFPQFPTGNGKIDIIIEYKNRVYGIELKSYTDTSGYKSALDQAALYGKQLKLKEVLLVFFLEGIDKQSREKYEKDYLDDSTGVKVIPIFVETG